MAMKKQYIPVLDSIEQEVQKMLKQYKMQEQVQQEQNQNMLDQIAMLEEQLGAGSEGLAASMKNIDWDKQGSNKGGSNMLSLSQSAKSYGKAKAGD